MLLYVVYAIVQGEVVVKSGVFSRRVRRDESPVRFWGCVAIYAALALVMIFVF